MELTPLALGVLCFLIGSICLKKEKHYKTFFILAILCFAVTLVLSILRLLDGMTIPL